MIDYLLEHGASSHVPNRDYNGGSQLYVLEGVLSGQDVYPYAPLLIRHSACFIADKRLAIFLVASKGYKGYEGYENVVNLLLDLRGADATMGPLHYAVGNRPIEMVKSILARPEADVAVRDWLGMNTLHHVA